MAAAVAASGVSRFDPRTAVAVVAVAVIDDGAVLSCDSVVPLAAVGRSVGIDGREYCVAASTAVGLRRAERAC